MKKKVNLLHDNIIRELQTPLLWLGFILALLFFLWVWS